MNLVHKSNQVPYLIRVGCKLREAALVDHCGLARASAGDRRALRGTAKHGDREPGDRAGEPRPAEAAVDQVERADEQGDEQRSEAIHSGRTFDRELWILLPLRPGPWVEAALAARELQAVQDDARGDARAAIGNELSLR